MSNPTLGPGNLYVISAPSGAGKTTLVKALVETIPNIMVSISHTTRTKRPNEIHAKHYYFIDEKEFKQKIDHNDFLEYAIVFNNFYGTSRSWVQETLARGMDVILEIDWQGSKQIQKLFPDCISIFILPPSLTALSERLFSRNQDPAEIIRERLSDVRESARHVFDFKYVVMNDDFNRALEDLKHIVLAGRLLQEHQTQKYANLLRELSALASLQ